MDGWIGGGLFVVGWGHWMFGRISQACFALLLAALLACLLSCRPLLRQLLLERKTTGCSDRKRERGCGKL